MTVQAPETGSMVYTNAGRDGSSSNGTGQWGADGSSWSNEATHSDGKWFRDQGEFRADGSGQTRSENSIGYRWTLRCAADGSGSGRIEGPDPGLPATIAWDESGVGTVTYADGSQEPWRWFHSPGAGGGNSSDGSDGPSD